MINFDQDYDSNIFDRLSVEHFNAANITLLYTKGNVVIVGEVVHYPILKLQILIPFS